MTSARINPLASQETEVLIAGAGPVGMLLALLLAQRGISSLVVEPRTSIHPHARAIGIHPPGLAALEQAGLSSRFLQEGILVPGGSVYVDDHWYGHLSFDQNPGKWKYPLLLPQHRTESLLEQACEAESRISLLRAWSLEAITPSGDGYRARCRGPHESETSIDTRYMIGCDGKRSRVRELLGISWKGMRYRDRYVLGDIKDDTSFGERAIIYLTQQGLVESFPLQTGWRRWVVHIEPEELPESLRDKQSSWIIHESTHWHKLLQSIIETRTGHRVDERFFGLVGSFGIERRLAGRVCQGNAFLAGDAAHVVSPIGGQGMNLGWMDALDLADTIDHLRRCSRSAERARIRQAYQRTVLRRARSGLRRAGFNTVWGRSGLPLLIRKVLVRAILTEPLRSHFSRQFTMTNLP